MLYPTQITRSREKVNFGKFSLSPHINRKGFVRLASYSLIASISLFSTPPSFAANPASQAPLYDGQILHIDCNGDVNDKSVVGRSVTNVGVTFFNDRLGNRNRSCFFDSMGYLKIAKSPDLNLSNFTISAWVTVDRSSAGNSYAIVSNYSKPANANSGFQHYGINMKDGIAAAFYDDGTGMGGVKYSGASAIKVNDSSWHHVAAVFTGGSKSKIYVDGVLQASSVNTMPLSINPTGDLYIGRGGDTEVLEKKWQGKLDEVRILNRALSAEEVNNLLAVVDTPTGEIFTPLGTGDTDPFLVETKDGTKPVMVTPNQDGSVSVNTLSNSNARSGAREGGTGLTVEPQTLVLNNGNMTLLDETQPSTVVTLDNLGNLKVTDSNVPDLQLNLFKNKNTFVFTSISNPSVSVEVNHDGSLLINDKARPNISILRGKDAKYTIIDRETGAVTLADASGNAVLSHPDAPGLAATFNVFDQTADGFTLVDTVENACIKINADGSVDSNSRGNFFKKVGNAIKNVFQKAVPVVKNAITPVITSTINNVVSGGAKGLVNLAKTGFGKLATAWPCLAPLTKFAIVGGVVAVGAAIVGGIVAGVIAFNKQKKKIRQLEGQVQQLQATIQIQQQRISELETTVAEQVKKITALEAKVAEQEATIKALSDQVAAQQATIQQLNDRITQQDAVIQDLNNRMANMQQTIDQQAAFIAQQAEELRKRDDLIAQLQETIARMNQTIAAMQQQIDDLNNRLRAAERGVDEIPEGEPPAVAPKRSVRASAECSVLVDSVIEFLRPTVDSQSSRIILNWVTDAEINIAGFNVKRSTAQDKGELVNPTLLNEQLIPSKSLSPATGARYEFTDNTAVEGITYYYQIESVDTKKNATPYKAYVLKGKLVTTLAKFADVSVSFVMGQAKFAWQTLSERGSVAFNLWMAKPEGSCEDYGAYTNVTKLNERPIPATGASNLGKSYIQEVAGAVAGYCYGVEEIDVNGTSAFYVIGDGINGIMAVN
jgi:uncharacterized coiled-coil protein SlyX